MTTQEFIKRAKFRHGHTYNYSSVEYKNKRDKICITCIAHGDFYMLPHNHLRGSGCKKCAAEKRKMGYNEFVRRATLKFGDVYDYSLSELKGMHSPITIKCKKHGEEFVVLPYHHIAPGESGGCQKCGIERRNKKNSMSNVEFIDKANTTHKSRYKYFLTNEIKNQRDRIKIECPIHGLFEQTINTHLNGAGCPSCSNREWYRKNCRTDDLSDLSGLLYVITLVDKETKESFLKIGITTQTVSKRFSRIRKTHDISVLKTVHGNMDVVYQLEKYLHKELRAHKIKPGRKFPGWTECFDTSVFAIAERLIQDSYNESI